MSKRDNNFLSAGTGGTIQSNNR